MALCSVSALMAVVQVIISTLTTIIVAINGEHNSLSQKNTVLSHFLGKHLLVLRNQAGIAKYYLSMFE